MAKKFKDLGSLFAYINKNIKEVMETDIVEAVKDEQQRQIEKEVYDVYTPLQYDRRRDEKGGLQDRDSMVARPIKKTKDGYLISVVNLAKGKNEDIYLAPLVEYGEGTGHGSYQYPKYNRDSSKWTYMESRPFTQATIDALKKSGMLTQVMKQELNRRGIKTV